MRHYEAKGGKGLVTASMGVSMKQPSRLMIVHLNVMHMRTVWLNVCIHVLYCFRLVDVHVELCTSVYGSYTYKEAALHVA